MSCRVYFLENRFYDFVSSNHDLTLVIYFCYIYLDIVGQYIYEETFSSKLVDQQCTLKLTKDGGFMLY